ncbi:hypothetical protein ABIC28_002759 [Rhodococcus sp. PvR044]|jgi:hypothetical protein|uniref:ImmA/IrrE family metallo-endopeptidase n=1 Tax=Rhodococcus TaxID=1827 RepID=UPI000BDD9EB6|nr:MULTISPECIES: DUF955 domain-containing protein [Rhodococcus]MBP1162005.1 hypothetical protein [Rhodococcus sp. PvR099]MCZ4557761.1 DUF955 domain-containing protein [Rhodococcus maanshanensis]PTR43284.1 hypothetical protein C8K38_108155 [Rhodococcus sp. OK611]SNX91147.1 hypothetical protein SAMN05447004_108153 [Rhodococcus sp. OK270]
MTKAIRSHRRVSAAVDAVCAVAASAEASSLASVVVRVAAERGREITVRTQPLPIGVYGQHLSFVDHDEIIIADGLPNPDRTLAHELGHVVFGHAGAAIEEETLAADDDLIAYMLSQRSRGVDPPSVEHEIQEWEAETFAGLLLHRLAILSRHGNPVSVLRYDEALG